MIGLARMVVASAVLATLVVACGGRTRCVEGESQGCVCTDGRTGAQLCNAMGNFEACVCAGGMLDAALPDAYVDPSLDAWSAMPDTGEAVDAPPGADAPMPGCTLGATCACAGDTLGYCESSGCVCDPGPVPCAQDVDWLFLVDTSNSMAEEQVVLANELPRLVRVLASGDANEDGTRDFMPVRSLHLGVITPDLGAGELPTVPTCLMGWGEDGILRRRGPSCGAEHPSGVFDFMPGGGTTPDAFAMQFSCVARAGTGGCGFEQQLEASLRAVSPSATTAWTRPGYVPPTFRDGSSGHALGPNAGFVRTDSVLAITLVTDEDDCSVPDTGLFDVGDARFMGVGLNARCVTFEETATYPSSRYVDGLLGLRPHPGLLVYSAITGIPTGTFASYDALLADPTMTPRIEMGDRVTPVCTSANGSAAPARRLVEVARGLDRAGAQTSVSSICASTFQTAVSDVVRALVAARGSC